MAVHYLLQAKVGDNRSRWAERAAGQGVFPIDASFAVRRRRRMPEQMEKAMEMNYLDVNPMIQSLRTNPEDFSLNGNWLTHRKSRHHFSFEDEGRVQIRAACGCAFLLIKPEQQRDLYDSFRAWEASYWRPLRVNREFASHFHRRSWRGIVIRFATRLASWLAEERPEAASRPLPFLSRADLFAMGDRSPAAALLDDLAGFTRGPGQEFRRGPTSAAGCDICGEPGL